MQFTLAVCLTALAALTSAYTPANTAQPPSGNPIGHPELGELITAGQAYTITWAPDTGGEASPKIPISHHRMYTDSKYHITDRVTILLLRGPSNNVVPILTIAEAIPNTGSYIWPSVPTTLEPDITGYGIQLIVEGSGAYQYSPQCGVKNDAFNPSSGGSTTSSSSATTSGSTTVTLVPASTTASSSSSISYVTYATGIPSAAAAGTGAGGNFSVPVLSPTKTMSVPATLQSTFANTMTRSASSTGGGVAVATATGGAVMNNLVGQTVAVLVAGAVGVFAL